MNVLFWSVVGSRRQYCRLSALSVRVSARDEQPMRMRAWALLPDAVLEEVSRGQGCVFEYLSVRAAIPLF